MFAVSATSTAIINHRRCGVDRPIDLISPYRGVVGGWDDARREWHASDGWTTGRSLPGRTPANCTNPSNTTAIVYAIITISVLPVKPANLTPPPDRHARNARRSTG